MRTFDCFPFFNELDLLEIRLNILDEYVDYFVLCESAETFSGKEKPLYYDENRDRFAKWRDKIIYIKAPKCITDSAFERAGFQKDFIRETLFKYNLRDNDLVYYGDLDEVWTPQEIKDDKVYNLEQLNYCYYLNNRSSERWVGTIVGRWKTVKTEDFARWRATHTNELTDGGWHFTNIGGVEQIKKKLEAYDHQENNTHENHILIEDRIKDGEDYAGRSVDWEGKPFKMWIDESDLPKYLLENKEKYVHLFK